MRRSARFLLPLLVCLCLAAQASATTTGMEVRPLGDLDKTYYEYYLSKPGLSVLIRADATIKVLVNEQGQDAVMIRAKEFPDTYFILFAIEAGHLKGQAISAMEDAGVRSVLQMISQNPGKLAYERIDGIVPGNSVLRVPEYAGTTYAEHLVALNEGWVLNMMAQRLSGHAFTDAEKAFQEAILQSALAESDMLKRWQTYRLADGGAAISLPKSMYMHLTKDGADRKELGVNLYTEGTQHSVLHLYAVRDPAYLNRTADSLTGEAKEAALNFPAFGSGYKPETLSVIRDFEPGIPVLAYESDGDCSHLLALRDGWALYASVLPFAEYIDPDWVNKLQAAVMHQWLGGSINVPDWLPAVPITQKGNTLSLPLSSRVVTIPVPFGYGVQIEKDTYKERTVYLYPLSGASKYICISLTAAPSFTGNDTLTDLYATEELNSLCDSAVRSVREQTGASAAADIIQEGIAGLPAMHVTTGDKSYEEYYWLMDSYILSVSFASEGSPITEAESALLKNLIGSP